jgi:hypothetical protein
MKSQLIITKITAAKRIAFQFLVMCVTPLLIMSCSDDPTSAPSGVISLSVTNLKPLSQGASYELWVSFPSASRPAVRVGTQHAAGAFVSAGKFNIDATGNIIAANGGTMTFRLPTGKNLSLAADAVISYQPSGVDSLYAIIIGGVFMGDDRTGRVSFTHTYQDAFTTSLNNFRAKFLLNTDSGDYRRGLWFADTLQNRVVNAIVGTPIFNGRWVYELLVQKTATNELFSIATFEVPPASTAAPLGQIFASIPNLATGEYQAIVAVRPKFNSSAAPFMLPVASKVVPQTIAQRQPVALDSRLAEMPTASMTISR